VFLFSNASYNNSAYIDQVAIPMTVANQVTVFYNIFIPNSDAGQNNAIRIVEEQLDQIKSSFLASKQDIVEIHYVTIGPQDVLTDKMMGEFCGQAASKLKCKQVDHISSGYETTTLGHAYSFCRRNPLSRVIYIHNKGSYHFKPLNEKWRRILTETVFSELCLQENILKQNCNVCGLNFFTQ